MPLTSRELPNSYLRPTVGFRPLDPEMGCCPMLLGPMQPSRNRTDLQLLAAPRARWTVSRLLIVGGMLILPRFGANAEHGEELAAFLRILAMPGDDMLRLLVNVKLDLVEWHEIRIRRL